MFETLTDRRYLVALLMAFDFVAARAADRQKVKIIDSRASSGSYTYVVPGTARSSSTSDVNCSLYPNSANCSGITNTTSTVTPARQATYSVQGATFSLLLSDGRIVVANCNSKLNWTELRGGPVRSCRMPIVTDIEAEFSGQNAKLFWPVSVDGKKMESESYRILGIMAPSPTWQSSDEHMEAVGGELIGYQADGSALYRGTTANPVLLQRNH